jgi:hypothetical protein
MGVDGGEGEAVVKFVHGVIEVFVRCNRILDHLLLKIRECTFEYFSENWALIAVPAASAARKACPRKSGLPLWRVPPLLLREALRSAPCGCRDGRRVLFQRKSRLFYSLVSVGSWLGS